MSSDLSKAARLVAAIVLLLLSVTGAQAGAPIYSQPLSATAAFYQSSVNGTDYDRWTWDDFVIPLGQTAAVTDVEWLGTYDPARAGIAGPVVDFHVAIYPSIAGGSQPNVTQPPLIEDIVAGVAGETPYATVGNLAVYHYSVFLPSPLQLTGGKYWLHVEATQAGIPSWGMVGGMGGNGKHFAAMPTAGDIQYFNSPGDLAFNINGTTTGGGVRVFLPMMMR